MSDKKNDIEVPVSQSPEEQVNNEENELVSVKKKPIRKMVLIGVAVGMVVCLAVGLGVGLGVDWSSDDSSDPDLPDDPDVPDVPDYPDNPDFPEVDNKLNHTVETQNGRIMGFRYDPEATQYNGLPVNNLLPNIQHNSTYFLGIPYAAPPVGNLRWRAPANPVSWDDVLLADKTGPACAQKCDEPCDEQESSEDCLYLNVFVPNRAIDQKEKVAVAIWFHGGAFRWGQGGSILYDGRVVSGQADHIIVTVNYRLSAFGFFYKNFIEQGETNDGNWGFLDQQKAIKWVHENIEAFNGDSKRITVYGESAGAISSLQHVINEESQKYFQRAIIQSNPLTIPFKEAWEAAIQGNLFAKEIGCPDFNMECLRSKSVQDVVRAVDDTPIIINKENILHAAMPFSPVVEENIIKKQPMDSLLAKEFDQTKYIIWGQVEHETEIYVRTVFGSPVNNVVYNNIWRILIQDQEKAEKIIERFPSQCSQKSDLLEGLIKASLKDAKPADLLFDKSISQIEETECKKMCKEDCTSEDGRLCGILTTLPSSGCEKLTDVLCSGFCSADEYDERRTAEPPATQWIFTCPVRKALKAIGADFFVYEFRDYMPIDLTKVGDEGDGWENYDSCEEFACHGAELSYCFASEKQLNCTAAPEFGDMFDQRIFSQCFDDGQIVSQDGQRMERYMHRLWANFITTGDPNDESQSKSTYYSDNFPGEKLSDIPVWKTFRQNNGWLRISSHDGFKYEEKFHQDDCDFWDSLELY